MFGRHTELLFRRRGHLRRAHWRVLSPRLYRRPSVLRWHLARRRVVPRPAQFQLLSLFPRQWRLLHLQLPVRNLRMDRSQSLRRRFRLSSLRLARRRTRLQRWPLLHLGAHLLPCNSFPHQRRLLHRVPPLPVPLLHRTLLLHRPAQVPVLHLVLRQRLLCR